MAWSLLLAVGLLIVLAVLLLRLRGRRERRVFRRLCAAVGASPAGKKADGTEQGVGYRLEHGRIGGAAFLRVTLLGQCPHRWWARRLTDTSSASQVEVGARVETGDALFDRDVELRSDSADFAAAYFIDLRHQRAAQKLFGLGVTSLSLDGSLEATWQGLELRDDLDPQLVTAALKYLAGMASGLPGLGANWRTEGMRAPRTLALAFPLLLWAGGVAFAGWGLTRFPPVDAPRVVVAVAFVSLLLAALFFVFLRRVFSFGGRPWSTFLLSLPALPLLACGALLAVNGWGDRGTPAAYSVTAVELRPLPFPLDTHWFVKVSPWRTREDSCWLWVRRGAPEQIVAGRTKLLILTRSGRIGIEWLVEMSER